MRVVCRKWRYATRKKRAAASSNQSPSAKMSHIVHMTAVNSVRILNLLDLIAPRASGINIPGVSSVLAVSNVLVRISFFTLAYDSPRSR